MVLLATILAADEELRGETSIPALYREHLGTLGQRVRVQLAAGDVDGTAIGVEDDGRLVVLDDCAITHRIDTGDVVHLRPS
jgi:BirA family biotin operon repressor/biotin-[acetyl-CoA-carboxylase] ligase